MVSKSVRFDLKSVFIKKSKTILALRFFSVFQNAHLHKLPNVDCKPLRSELELNVHIGNTV